MGADAEMVERGRADRDAYYRDLFPVAAMDTFLTELFCPFPLDQVDFMVTSQKEGPGEKEFCQRYRTWTDVKHQLAKGDIVRLDVSSVFIEEHIASLRPILVKTDNLVIGKPLMFDIDLPERPRCCGAKKRTCHACWMSHIIPYYRTVETFLLGVLPPKARLRCFYSGARGLHFWVTDPYFITLSHAQKIALVDYIERELRVLAPDIIFDRAVTTAPRHPLRLPFSLHQETGHAVLPLVRGLVTEKDERKLRQLIHRYLQPPTKQTIASFVRFLL